MRTKTFYAQLKKLFVSFVAIVVVVALLVERKSLKNETK